MERLSLLAIFAHPDDEAYSAAGTLAKHASEGVLVSLIAATRGEAGEVSDPTLATGTDLGMVRESELRHACSIMGVANLRFLDCPDGGVMTCPATLTIGKIVAAIREWRPQVVITFGPEGVYGHPDHVAVHQLAVSACDLAGDGHAFPEQLYHGLNPWAPPKLYFVALPNSMVPELGNEFSRIRAGLDLPAVDIADFFATEEEVTSAVDISPFLDIKKRTIAAHRTQVSDADIVAMDIRPLEFFRLRGASRNAGQPYESNLFELREHHN